jgi:hypothetical protein
LIRTVDKNIEEDSMSDYDAYLAPLFKDFPLLYQKQIRGDDYEFYFETPVRWHIVLRELSIELTKLIKEIPLPDEMPYAIQVKEKFGGLRFYMTWQTDEMSAAIRRAEVKIQEMENHGAGC